MTKRRFVFADVAQPWKRPHVQTACVAGSSPVVGTSRHRSPIRQRPSLKHWKASVRLRPVVLVLDVVYVDRRDPRAPDALATDPLAYYRPDAVTICASEKVGSRSAQTLRRRRPSTPQKNGAPISQSSPRVVTSTKSRPALVGSNVTLPPTMRVEKHCPGTSPLWTN